VTADEIVSRARDAGSIPVRADLTSQKIIDESNSEFFSRLVTRFRKTRGNYLSDYFDIAVVANQARYAIPERAVESSLDLIKYIDSNGNDCGALSEITLKQVGGIRPDGVPYTETSTYPVAFYLDADSIMLSPVPTTAVGSLRVYYPRRPGSLVITSTNYAQVTSVAAGVLTCGSVNTSTFTATSVIDVQRSKSPYRLAARDLQLTASAAGSVTICIAWVVGTVYAVGDQRRTATGIYQCTIAGTSAAAGSGPSVTSGFETDGTVTWQFWSLPLTSVVNVGDYVTIAKTAYVPGIPQEWHEILLDFTIAKVFAKLGDLKSETQWRAYANEKLKLLVDSSQPRVQDSQKKIVPRVR